MGKLYPQKYLTLKEFLATCVHFSLYKNYLKRDCSLDHSCKIKEACVLIHYARRLTLRMYIAKVLS